MTNAAAVSHLETSAAPMQGVPDVSPLTKGQVTYTAIVALFAWTFAVYDLITFGNLLPKIQQEFGWSNATASYVATLVGLASLVVALAVGPVIDRLGRRFALVLTTGGAALSSGLAAFAMGPGSLVIFRSLAGFGMSEQAVNSAYLNEVFSARAKGFLYGIVQAGWPVGVMLSAGLAAGFGGSSAGAACSCGDLPAYRHFVLRFVASGIALFPQARNSSQARKEGQTDRTRQLSERWKIESRATARTPMPNCSRPIGPSTLFRWG